MGRLKVPIFQTSSNKQLSLVLGNKNYWIAHVSNKQQQMLDIKAADSKEFDGTKFKYKVWLGSQNLFPIPIK